MRSRLIASALLVASLAVVTGCGSGRGGSGGGAPAADGTASVTIVKDWPVFWPMQTYIDDGVQRGIFKKDRLDAKFVTPPQAPDIVKLVATGRADFGIGNTLDLINANLTGLDVVGVAALWAKDMGGIVYFKDSGMKTPADLKGKTVAVYQWPQTKLHFQQMVRTAGLSPKDVKVVPGGDYSVPLLVSGKVDAGDGALGAEDLDTQRETKRKTGIWLYTQNGVPPFYTSVLFTRREFAKKNSALVTRTIKALFDAEDHAIANPAQAVAAAKKAHKEIDVANVEKAWKELLPYRAGYKPDQPRGDLDESVIGAYQDFLAKGGLIKAKAPPAALVDNSLLPKSSAGS